MTLNMIASRQLTSGQGEGDDGRRLRLVDGDGSVAKHQRRVNRRLERTAQQVIAGTGCHHGLPDSRRRADPVFGTGSWNW